ncbi:MAG TPA: hypothetical protein VNO31_46335 [Umezawaea sp.]|nr:hypothetical protein [Umezawaea sp.]
MTTNHDDVRIHALIGPVEVLSSTAADPAVVMPSPEEQTRPIRRFSGPVVAWLAVFLPMRARWRSRSRGVRTVVLVLVAALGVLVLRLADTDAAAGPTAARPTDEQPATTSSSVTSKPSVIPVGVPATEDPAGVSPVRPTPEQMATLPLAGLVDPLPSAPVDPAPTAPMGGDILHPVETTAVYTAPGGPAIVRLPVTLLGADTWVPVIDRQPGWAMVLLPAAVPDDMPSPAGWIHLTPAVEFGRVDRHIRIDGRSGTVSVVAALGEASPAAAPAADRGRRTFVVLAPSARPRYWPASVWWPIVVRAERLCPQAWGGTVIPGLRWGSLPGRLDPTGCLPVPAPARSVLQELSASTAVLVL